MAKLVRYQPSLRGLKKLRSSREVDQELERRAQAVADAAEAAYSTIVDEFIDVDVVQAGSDTPAPRARVAVIARHPEALIIEDRWRILGGSLDAAR